MTTEMKKYVVRLTGTMPVWVDITVEAETPEAARQMVADDSPADRSDWEFCDGGSGVNDWEFAETMDADFEEVEE